MRALWADQMESQMEPEKRPLTPNDPVDSETLEQFRQLQEARQALADDLLAIEQRKIQLLASAKKIDEQRNRLFERCLVDRGMPPDTTVTIDSRTGVIELENKAAKAVG